MRQSSEQLSFERLEDRMLLSTLVVNSLADNTTAGDGLVTLREAIHAANTLGTTDLGDSGSIGLDQIVFASGLSGSILLTSGELDVIGDLLITGNGRNDIVIDAQQNSRIFDVTGVDTDLTLDNLKLQNGRTTSDNNGGGAIRFTATGIGTLSVLNSTLLNNSTAGDSAHGGAIYSLTGDVSVSGSLLNGNWTEGQSSFGGAIASPTAGDINVLNSTLSGNHVDGTSGSGGAIASPSLLGKTVIVGSTITGNEATTGGGIGMFALNLGKSLTIRNCIVAGNIADQHADFTAPGGLLSTLDVTNSLIGDNDGTTLSATLNGVFDSLGNLVGSTTGDGVIDPHLAPLADNGGPTLTHALLPGSLALDSGNNTSSNDAGMVHDQRGAPFLRVYGAGVDMGS
ncbi:MAG: hypothetical protein KDA75_09015, partial [Planctomycetaceae bacterium]|nr:hypothetical protein [Planctomycetaceae bacterium]